MHAPDLSVVDKRRLQLWGMTLLLLAACAGGLALASALGAPFLPSWLGADTLRLALVTLIVLFSLYAIDAELRLRALTRRLVEERVLTAALTHRLAEVDALLEVGRSLSVELRLDRVLQAVLRAARELLDARDSSLLLVQGDEELRTVAVEGDSNAGGARVRFGEGIAGRVAATRQPLLIEGTIPGLVKQLHQAPPGSAMSAPLVHGDALLGVINVNARDGNEYSPHDLRAFADFARQAAIAIANAQMFESRRHRGSAERLESLHDPLTGLPNRALLLDRLDHLMVRRRPAGQAVALLAVDLDNFRRINEALGHHAGDELLAAFAERVRSVVRAGDTLGRLGSDEIGVVTDPVRDPEEVLATARRVLDQLAEPFRIDGRDLTVTATIGGAIGVGRSIDLLRQANLALRASKAAGPGEVVLFTPDLDSSPHSLDFEEELRRAVADAALEVYYQPIVQLADRRLVAAEALIRWPHRTRGLLGAGTFVPLAEQLGLLPAIDRIVVSESLALAATVDREYGLPLRIAANFAPSRLREPGLIQEIQGFLDRAELPPQRFMLEVTESSVLRDVHAAATQLSALRALGVSLSLDDFGTGYSSLTHLQRFPVDGVKIDRSFVVGLTEHAPARDLVDGILRLAKGLGLAVIAEGVEEEAQARLLEELGCQFAQGFHLGRPMPAAQFLQGIARS